MPTALQRFIVGKPSTDGKIASKAECLASTPLIDPRDAQLYQQQVPVSPITGLIGTASQALAMVRASDTVFVFARSEYHNGKLNAPLCEYVVIPPEVLIDLEGDLTPLRALFSAPLRADSTPLSTVSLATSAGWTPEREYQVLALALQAFEYDFQRLLSIMCHAFHGEGALISHFPNDLERRLAFIQALRLLLPASYRHYLTFSTHSERIPPYRPRLIFCDVPQESQRAHIDWMAEDVPVLDTQANIYRYFNCLSSLWQGDLHLFIQQRHELDKLARKLPFSGDVAHDLARLAERQQLHQALLIADDTLSIEKLLSVLESDFAPDELWRWRLFERLLALTLEERRADVALYIAQAMDADIQLDARLASLLEATQAIQPDAVYSFVRARLLDTSDASFTPIWQERLHAAAEQALSLAIFASDSTTLFSWLNLIAREPVRFELGEVLCAGISASAQRAWEDGQFGRDLLALAVKRCPDVVHELLGDARFVRALPSELSNALLLHDARAIEHLAEQSRELFLLALARALRALQPCISPITVRALWDFERVYAPNSLPHEFSPPHLLKQLSYAPQALMDGTLEMLLVVPLTREDDANFRELAHRLRMHPQIERLLFEVLEQSQRSPQDMGTLMVALLNDGTLTGQQAADIDAAVLANHEWQMNDLPIVEHLARLLTQNNDMQLPPNVLWHMLEISSAMKNETMGKVVMRRLLSDFASLISEANIARDISRLRRLIAWSHTLKTLLMAWWRDYVRTQTLGQLQKLERSLEAYKGMEDFRASVQTMLALRRLLGNRTLSDFAHEIAVTFKVLQTLSDAFDPEDSEGIEFDSATIHAEFDAHRQLLAPELRHVLATNLRQLGQLLVDMTERRSKPSLIRNDETLERQLLSGEQTPQSAIDFMKWCSGYLDGSHKPDEKPNETS